MLNTEKPIGIIKGGITITSVPGELSKLLKIEDYRRDLQSHFRQILANINEPYILVVDGSSITEPFETTALDLLETIGLTVEQSRGIMVIHSLRASVRNVLQLHTEYQLQIADTKDQGIQIANDHYFKICSS